MPLLPPTRLDDETITAALATLPHWRREGDHLTRSLVFRDFSEAFGFMARVALLCERNDHHPDWSNCWNRVHLQLTTHETGGISARDLALAQGIEQLLQSPG